MIKCDKEKIKFFGDNKTLAAEFCVIGYSLLTEGVLTENILDVLMEEVKEAYQEDIGDEEEGIGYSIKINAEELKKQLKRMEEEDGRNKRNTGKHWFRL